jgi:FtsH-binding integral membrane protein
MLSKIYLLLGAGLLLLYGVAAWSGWELSTSQRQTLPADVRNSPGGYRSFHFWHSGYRGGK